MNVVPVILADGFETGLWPLSRQQYPKLFLSLLGSRSLLQATVARLEGLPLVQSPIVVCNEEHRFLVRDQINLTSARPAVLLLESVARGTAPAATLGALAALELSRGSDCLMMVMPADHLIKDVEAFQSTVAQGYKTAEEGYVVAFGVTSTAPLPEYGYIGLGERLEDGFVGALADGRNGSRATDNGRVAVRLPTRACFAIADFREKPDAPTARALVQSGRYLWNSGIYLMRASVWLAQMDRWNPEMAEVCRQAHAMSTWDGPFLRPDGVLFSSCPSGPIEDAIIEKLEQEDRFLANRRGGYDLQKNGAGVVYLLDAGWSDVLSWSALSEQADSTDPNGNVLEGDTWVRSTRDSLIISQKRLVAVAGLEEIVVVETPDAVLVASKSSMEDIKALVEQLHQEHRPEQVGHQRVYRPWGHYEVVDSGPRFQVKRIVVRPGASLSLQMHHHRSEHWIVVRGTARITRGEETFLLVENQSTYIPIGETHRLENPGAMPLEIIEVQVGSYLGEDDILRFQDTYGRADQSQSHVEGTVYERRNAGGSPFSAQPGPHRRAVHRPSRRLAGSTAVFRGHQETSASPGGNRKPTVS
ncbi:MAG: mannose-1-phosphate guanylyltransferase/mannose-6-phosphate isomerase [Chloroflexi bacterium]|nr:mannose-1-phosphate guanylyltransferase/mannose-6-phosphate isomerase [Chloroflexota bacterium]